MSEHALVLILLLVVPPLLALTLTVIRPSRGRGEATESDESDPVEGVAHGTLWFLLEKALGFIGRGLGL